jgi:transposase-like protein
LLNPLIEDEMGVEEPISLSLNPLIEDEMEVDEPKQTALPYRPVSPTIPIEWLYSQKATPTPLPYKPTSPVIPVNWFPSKVLQDKHKEKSSPGSTIPLRVRNPSPQEDCPKCGRRFAVSYMNVHMRKCHPPDTRFLCQECHERFVCEEELEHHVENVHPKVFLCKKCDKDFPDNNFLVSHYRFKHGELKPVLVSLLKVSENDTRMDDGCGPGWESHM